MQKKLKKTIQSNLDFRINPELKEVLDEYCEENLEKNTEAIVNAIKGYINFGGTAIQKPGKLPDPDKGKTLRLNIKIHSRLKGALEEYCKKHGETLTDAITNSIKAYIGCSKTFL